MLTHTQAGGSVADRQGILLVEDGRLTAHGLDIYTRGDCWAVAWHFAMLLGVPEGLHVLGRQDQWCHVVVQVDEDLFLDVLGLSTREETEKRWRAKLNPLPFWATTSLEVYEDVLNGGDFKHWVAADQEEAARVAEALLATFSLPQLA